MILSAISARLVDERIKVVSQLLFSRIKLIVADKIIHKHLAHPFQLFQLTLVLRITDGEITEFECSPVGAQTI